MCCEDKDGMMCCEDKGGTMGCKDEGGMMGMMSKMMEMMGGGEGKEMPMGPEMMMEMMPQMMPHCLAMILPNMPKNKRTDFILNMLATLMEQGCAGMSKEEKEELVAKVIEKVKA